jgi:hypothetical protein
MERRIKKITVKSEIDMTYDRELNSYIAYLKQVADNLTATKPYPQHTNFKYTINLESHYDDYEMNMLMTCERYETDSERVSRERKSAAARKAAATRKQKKELVERAMLRNLKAKYE